MSLDREATRGVSRTAMAKLSPTFMNHLLVQVDPHRQSIRNEVLRSAQVVCSRWLALRRLRVDLPIQQLAAMTNLSAELILLIETGLADASMLSDDARRRLAANLAPSREDIKLAADVILVALGQDEARSESLIGRVIADLEALDGVKEPKAMPVAEVAASSTPGIDHLLALLRAAPTMFDALWILNEGANHAWAIFQAMQRLSERSRDKQARYNTQFGSMLHEMIDHELIMKSEQKVLPNLPGRPLQYYMITEVGRRAFNFERTRRVSVERKLLEAIQQTNEDPGLGYPNPLPNP